MPGRPDLAGRSAICCALRWRSLRYVAGASTVACSTRPTSSPALARIAPPSPCAIACAAPTAATAPPTSTKHPAKIKGRVSKPACGGPVAQGELPVLLTVLGEGASGLVGRCGACVHLHHW